MRISYWSSDVCSSDLKVREVQKLWQNIYCLPDLATDGSQWDRLFAAGDRFMLGETQIRVMLSPGHTLASVSYVADEQAFVHDTLMMPDAGPSRADFPGGDARQIGRAHVCTPVTTAHLVCRPLLE